MNHGLLATCAAFAAIMAPVVARYDGEERLGRGATSSASQSEAAGIAHGEQGRPRRWEHGGARASAVTMASDSGVGRRRDR
jgi:hypothetical protein